MLYFTHLLYTFRHGFAGINSPKGSIFIGCFMFISLLFFCLYKMKKYYGLQFVLASHFKLPFFLILKEISKSSLIKCCTLLVLATIMTPVMIPNDRMWSFHNCVDRSHQSGPDRRLPPPTKHYHHHQQHPGQRIAGSIKGPLGWSRRPLVSGYQIKHPPIITSEALQLGIGFQYWVSFLHQVLGILSQS